MSKWTLLSRGFGILVPFCIFTIGVCFLSVRPKFWHPWFRACEAWACLAPFMWVMQSVPPSQDSSSTDHQLIRGGSFRRNNAKLIIPYMKRSHAGVYTCELRVLIANQQYKVSRTIVVHVEGGWSHNMSHLLCQIFLSQVLFSNVTMKTQINEFQPLLNHICFYLIFMWLSVSGIKYSQHTLCTKSINYNCN